MAEDTSLQRALIAEFERRIDAAELRLQKLELWAVKLPSLGDRLTAFRRLVLSDMDRLGRELDEAEREALIIIVRGALGLSPSVPSEAIMAQMGQACNRLSEMGMLGGYGGRYKPTLAGIRLGLLYSLERGE